MNNRVLLLFNGTVIGLVLILLLGRFTSSPGTAQATFIQPEPAATAFTATQLAYVTFAAGDTNRVTTSLMVQALDTNGRVSNSQAPQTLSSQAEPVMCQTEAAYGSGNGRYLILQYNCEANLFIQLQDLSNPDAEPIVYPRGYFLNWSPDSKGFLFRNIDEDQILYVPVDQTNALPFDLPFGTYDAAFAPNGQSLVYAINKGLGFGSEIGVIDLSSGQTVAQQKFPQQIVAYPQWAPDSTQLAYILMPDSNIPFTIGELWLADAAAAPIALLDAQVDAGHGYPPAWSPDGQTIAYIRRENPDSVVADHRADALHSNIYQIEIAAVAAAISQAASPVMDAQATPMPATLTPMAAATPLTQFAASLVYDMVWSPDGSQLAFTANDAVWTVTPGEEAVQISPANVIARHPVWTVSP
ncbi:MAG: hypothetical protein M5U34_16255 [Chloroflexi bacterium]|nr:hypothetical protein [Chloroflexota bacterium]